MQEWLAEAFTMWGLSALVIAVIAVAGGEHDPQHPDLRPRRAGPRGIDHDSVATFDDIAAVPKSVFTTRLGRPVRD